VGLPRSGVYRSSREHQARARTASDTCDLRTRIPPGAGGSRTGTLFQRLENPVRIAAACGRKRSNLRRQTARGALP